MRNESTPRSQRTNTEREARRLTVTPQKVLYRYEAGRITVGSAVIQVCQLASDQNPATFAESLPSEWLTELRERTANIPTPEEIRIVWGVTWVGTPEAYSVWEKAEQERYVAGLRAWKAYFDAIGSQG